MKILIEILLCGIAAYFIILALLFVFQRNLMYFPHHQIPDAAEFENSGGQVITVETADGLNLQGWHRAADDPEKPTIVMFHGNASKLEWSWDKTKDYADAGYGVLLAGYRGYGKNPGKPTEEGLYEDGRAYLRWLGDTDIILYGESLGTGVSVQMATEFDVKAVILEAPFTSTLEVAQRSYKIFPLKALMKDQYRSIEKIDRINAPLLIVHGQRDMLIPISIGRKLFDAAREPKQFVALPNGAHADMLDHGLTTPVLEFLNDLESD